MALGLTLGIILAVSGGPVRTLDQSALGDCGSSGVSPAAAVSAAAPARFGSPAAPARFGSPAAPARFGSPAAPARFGSPAAPARFGSPAAPARFGSPAAPAESPAATAGSGSSATAAPGSPATTAGSPAAPTAPGSPAAPASPCVTASGSGSPAAGGGGGSGATATPPATVNPEIGRADLAETDPVDPANDPIILTQSAIAAATTLNCTLIVPNHPLSARGLATPWQLSDGCSEGNPNQAAFVEASILAPNGKLTVYNPLVITQGTTPAVAPTVPRIRRGSQVIVEVGFNGNNLVLEGAGAYQGRCIDAFGNSILAQTSACNAQAFFADANFQMAIGRLRIPRLGMGNDGQTCESTHSFSLVDQDPSDNVDSEYLLTGNDQTAQDSAANKAALGGSTVISNGSDEGLLDRFVDPATGCTPPQGTDPTSANGIAGSQALNELSARQNQRGEVALLPPNDPQLLVDNQFSIGKTNAYRMLTDQPLIPPYANKNRMAAEFCQQMVNAAPAKLQLDQVMEATFTTPVPATGDNLATFMGARLAASFTNLGCQNFGLTDPATVTVDGNGVATEVTYDTAPQQANIPGWMSGNGRHKAYNWAPFGRHGHKENGSGM
jgi:hypothetical protein